MTCYGFARRVGAALAASTTVLAAAPVLAQAISYTDMQATQGAAAYGAECSRCHGANLQGAEGPALSGAQFDANWRGQPVKTMIETVVATMPPDRPNTLRADLVTVIIAHVLKTNGIPSGPQALPVSAPATMLIPPK